MSDDLPQIIASIPLDKWQREAIAVGIEKLSPKKSKEIADRLSSSLARLPDLVTKLESAIKSSLKDPQTLAEAIKSARMYLESGKLKEAQRICDRWIESSEGDVGELEKILEIIQLRYRLKPDDIFSVGQPITRDKKHLFVGRSDEMKNALDLLNGGFSLVITGEAGVGKTSFAWQLMELMAGSEETWDCWHLPDKPTNTYHCIWYDIPKGITDINEIFKRMLKPSAQDYTFSRHCPDVKTDGFHPIDKFHDLLSSQNFVNKWIIFLNRLNDCTGFGTAINSAHNNPSRKSDIQYVLVGRSNNVGKQPIRDDNPDVFGMDRIEKDHESAGRLITPVGEIRLHNLNPSASDISYLLDQVTNKNNGLIRFDREFVNELTRNRLKPKDLLEKLSTALTNAINLSDDDKSIVVMKEHLPNEGLTAQGHETHRANSRKESNTSAKKSRHQ